MNLVKRTLIVVAVAVTLRAGWAVWLVVRAPLTPPSSPLVVNDVSQMNPIRVDQVLAPTTTGEIVEAVRTHRGPVSIGGARHSMGGQIATENALFLDMRHFDRILDFSADTRTITAQAGATWRQIQDRIDPSNLSISIMQSYANFTLGGSLSVNGHGRSVGVGPLVQSVQSVKVVLADGSLVEASPTNNEDIFDAVIGGYGGIGVITEATLALTENVRVKRHSEVMPISKYRAYFVDHIRSEPSAIFHNANIFPDTYADVRAVTFSRTNDPVTVPERLFPVDDGYGLNRLAFWILSDWPFGKQIGRHVMDPLYFRGEPVEWRNYEASRDVAELEPASRADNTYVLQEYFVPVEQFDNFVLRMRRILLTHRVNVVNISVRHVSRLFRNVPVLHSIEMSPS
jgi:FAD/FMN-containing dehydrogenase